MAFAFHTVCNQAIVWWRTARAEATSPQFFRNLAAITTFLILPSWGDLLQALAVTKPPPRPP
jgi:hypothetical protein